MSRKVVQIAATVSGEGADRRESLYALDEDGGVWIIDPYKSDMEWSEVKPLPEKEKRKSKGLVPFKGLA